MHTHLYLVEQLDRQHRQEFVEQPARNRTAVHVSTINMTRSHTMNRMKLLAAAIIVAATLVSAGPRAFSAHHGTVPTVASLCCWIRK